MSLAPPSHAAEDRSPFIAAADALWIAATVLLAGVALLLILRRLAGALVAPLPSGGMVAAGIAAAGVTAAVRLGWRRRHTQLAFVAPWFPEAAATACLVLFAIALSVPDISGLGMFLLWLPLVVEESLAWHTLFRHRTQPAPSVVGDDSVADPVGNGVASYSLDGTASSSADGGSGDETELDAPPDETVLQQLARRVAEDGAEEISGWLRLPLHAGQQSGSLHVAFCPPLAAPPEVEFEQVDGPAARIKVAQAQAYGARLDVKLDKPAAETTSLLVQFFARVDQRA